jgi:hypothetical protein
MVKRDNGPDTYVTLKIPRPLYERLKRVIQGSGFHSVTEFAVYILRDLASHHDHPQVDVRQAERMPVDALGDVEPLSQEEIEAIRKRLQALGYL